jgi:predicted nucleic acid-binding protein
MHFQKYLDPSMMHEIVSEMTSNIQIITVSRKFNCSDLKDHFEDTNVK